MLHKQKNGVPACVCYYKAGIENGYNMRHGSKKLNKMRLNDCILGEGKSGIPRDYFYMSQNIFKRATNKIKKHFLNKKKKYKIILLY